jgi:peptide/nickel transport system permease protein
MKRSNRLSFRLGCALVLFFLAMAALAPILAPYDPAKIGISYLSPSAEHWLGTNDVGQDIFSELLYGARISIFIGIGSAAIVTVIGTVLGMTAGFLGGKADQLISALISAVLSLPALPLAFVIAAYFSAGIGSMMLSICITAWASTARLIRAKTTQLAKMPFISASLAMGTAKPSIMLRHILPNLTSLVFTKGALSISSAMLMEAGLSFLGLGVYSQKSWGKILYFALNRNGVINGYWWWYLPPILCISLCVMGFMLLCYQSE